MELLNSKLYSTDPETFFPELLRIIDEVLDVSRSYIFKYHENTNTISNTYEWNQTGIAPQIQKLQDIPVELIPYWHEFMINKRIINISNVKNIPSFPENQALVEQGIKSLMVIPIYVDGKYYGFLGIDECRQHRSWSELEIAFLKAMVFFIETLLEKKVYDI